MNQIKLSELSQDDMVFGKKGIEFRREQITNLVSVVKRNRNWRKEFLLEYPQFDNSEGVNLLNATTRGNASDPTLLKILEEWIPKITAEEPAWFVKKRAVDIPQKSKSKKAKK